MASFPAETPLSLQSAARVAVRSVFGLEGVNSLARTGLLTPRLAHFVRFRELHASIEQERHSLPKLNDLLRRSSEDVVVKRRASEVRTFPAAKLFVHHLPKQQSPISEGENGDGVVANAPIPPPPPPPPPPPTAPRPGFWRFPGAEFAARGVIQGN